MNKFHPVVGTLVDITLVFTIIYLLAICWNIAYTVIR